MKPLKTIFMGTSDYAIASLKALTGSGFELVLVVTQPDRPAGRGLELKPPPVKTLALELAIPVFQPEKISVPDSIDRLEILKPDLIVVASFGQFLPEKVLKMPSLACLNVHASILPKFRGASPIHTCILQGEQETGVTIMYMNQKMDEGDILLAQKTPIGPMETAGELHDRLASMGAVALLGSVELLLEKKAPRIPQDPSLASYAPRLKREQCVLDWKRSAQQLHDQVRGLNPWPGSEMHYGGVSLKLFKTRVLEGDGKPGEVVGISHEGVEVATGRGHLLILEIQPPGKKRMSAYDFTIGHPAFKNGVVIS